MYRLLIVDDEPYIVDWLYDLFGENTNANFDVYRAYSAKAALDWLSRTRIDIVLADINMPKMNGIQLQERIISEWPDCKVIFLTGYNEFEYAYHAIKKNAFGYILKTEKDDVIIETVQKAAKQLDEQMKSHEFIQKAQKQMVTAASLLQKEFLKELLEGNPGDKVSIADQAGELDIQIDFQHSFYLVYAKADHIEKGTTSIKQKEFYYSLDTIVKKYCDVQFFSEYVIMNNSCAVWIMQKKSNIAAVDGSYSPIAPHEHDMVFLRDTFEVIQAACHETLNSSISFALTNEPVPLKELNEKYSQLKEMISVRVGTEMLVTDKSFNIVPEPGMFSVPKGMDVLQMQLKTVETLKSYLQNGQKEDFISLFIKSTEFLKELKSFNYNPAIELYYSISLMLLSYINHKNLTEKLAFKIGLHKLMRIDEHETWQQAVEYLEKLAYLLFELQKADQELIGRDVILRIKNYISAHLNEDLSLVKLAEIAYFNPSYLSRFFKQMTGMNLSDYVFEVKINHAKKMLLDGTVKIHDVAKSVGFDSPTYFAKFFRRMANVNPQDYRDSILNK